MPTKERSQEVGRRPAVDADADSLGPHTEEYTVKARTKRMVRWFEWLHVFGWMYVWLNGAHAVHVGNEVGAFERDNETDNRIGM